MSHVYNPLTHDEKAPQPFVGAEEPYCAGHLWVPDGDGNAKLLAAGGFGDVAASERVFWFDPDLIDVPNTLAWSGGPVDLPGSDGRWYPSLTPFGDDATQKAVVAILGGGPTRELISPISVNEANPICPPQFAAWWTLASPFQADLGPPPASPLWQEHPNATLPGGSPYKSNFYPRPVVLSQGFLLSVGSEVVLCEDTMDDSPGFPSTNWGGNPVQVYNLNTLNHLAPVVSLDPAAR